MVTRALKIKTFIASKPPEYSEKRPQRSNLVKGPQHHPCNETLSCHHPDTKAGTRLTASMPL